MRLVGVDGCRFGWVATSLSDACGVLFKNIRDLIAFYEDDTVFLIDMPIGLPSKSVERECENIARKELSAQRKSSIFPIPCRAAVYAETYEMANQINRNILQKGISKQTWFICSKIKELDDFLNHNKNIQSKIIESHPELAFHYLNHRNSMKFNKKSKAGQQERLYLLSQFSKTVETIYSNTIEKFKRKDVAKDDVIDALCLTITLEEIIKHNILFEKTKADETNLGMNIHVFDASAFN